MDLRIRFIFRFSIFFLRFYIRRCGRINLHDRFQRGIIIRIPDYSPGLLSVGGQQKTFTLNGIWLSPIAPATNMTVDVILDGAGSVVEITAVPFQRLITERYRELLKAVRMIFVQKVACSKQTSGETHH